LHANDRRLGLVTPADAPVADLPVAASGRPEALPLGPLPPERLVRRCDPTQFAFRTTDEVEGLTDILGQPRAVEAIQFGIGVGRKGYGVERRCAKWRR
jgi:hypothetical protein